MSQRNDIMTSSAGSISESSLASPEDSGVHLDSESEIASIMSLSGLDASNNQHGDFCLVKYEDIIGDDVNEEPIALKANLTLPLQAMDLQGVDKTEFGSYQSHTHSPHTSNATGQDQIVYRRQRRKKTGKDAPKKRVSFHEDILNSTRIDDIHIERGFISRQPSFMSGDAMRKHNIVIGRYSWAAQGDTAYYPHESPAGAQRQTKSDLYVNRRYNMSSSSSVSFESSSGSSDDSPVFDDVVSEANIKNGLDNINKVPKSSCLKKTKHKRHPDMTVVHEEQQVKVPETATNNIFGSLKNIYRTLSTSLPAAPERGVLPEHANHLDDVVLDDRRSKRSSYASSCETIICKSFDGVEFNNLYNDEPPVDAADCMATSVATTPAAAAAAAAAAMPVHRRHVNRKPNLRLSRSEGFYPMYGPHDSSPIIFCDSNVYEHKGISYSYEYDKLQSDLRASGGSVDHGPPTKSSTIYQMLFSDLNFFKKLEMHNIKRDHQLKPDNQFVKVNVKGGDKNESDSETTLSDLSADNRSPKRTRHLQSPLRKRNKPKTQVVDAEDLSTIEVMSTVSSASRLSTGTDTLNSETDASKVAQQQPANMKCSASKTSLINRFLRTITQRKMDEVKLQTTCNGGGDKLTRAKPNLFIGGVRVDRQRALRMNRAMTVEISREKEAYLTTRVSSKQRAINPLVVEKLRYEVFIYSMSEKFYELFRVTSAYNAQGTTKPLLVALTNKSVYIASYSACNARFYNEFVLPFIELTFVVLAPSDHAIIFSTSDKSMQYYVATGSRALTQRIITAIISLMKKTPIVNVPQVFRLSVDAMRNLRRFLCDNTPIAKHDQFHLYAIVHLQENVISPTCTPLGPSRQGFLMYRLKMMTAPCKWHFGYFVLKASVLYLFETQTDRIPRMVTPLYNGACRSAHRTPPNPRPYTFELLTETNSFEIAASDEYECNDWLQALIQSASGLFNNDDAPLTSACSLIVTNEHMVTMRENLRHNEREQVPMRTLSYAAIGDLVAVKVPVLSNWCVLEFNCREVHESSSDWIVHFANADEFHQFFNVIKHLWYRIENKPFPSAIIAQGDPLYRECNDTSKTLQNAWSFLD